MLRVETDERWALDASETSDCRVHRTSIQEPLQEAACIKNLDAARVQSERAHGLARLWVSLQHEHVDAV